MGTSPIADSTDTLASLGYRREGGLDLCSVRGLYSGHLGNALLLQLRLYIDVYYSSTGGVSGVGEGTGVGSLH
jgi:hypothetical protein